MLRWLVVINRKTTKFESNSQRGSICTHILRSCYQSQNYKIWKQFTTSYFNYVIQKTLLSITKLQNLKAIHNLLQCLLVSYSDVINHKTTKFESNSQHFLRVCFSAFCCYQSQNYKIWKQFTTSWRNRWRNGLLLSITKLQNLKAIHNAI